MIRHIYQEYLSVDNCYCVHWNCI